MEYQYKTKGVCSRQINFTLTDGIVTNVHFVGGCDGNLKAIAKLVEGKTAKEIEATLKGNTCGVKSTSCADQLAVAIRKALGETE